jgi:formylglycine-generating enzyme required for sulfatase activity
MFCNHCAARNANGSRFFTCCGGSITPSITGPRQPGAAKAAETELEKRPARRFGSVRESREEPDGTTERRRKEENPKETKHKRNLAAVALMLIGSAVSIIGYWIGRGGVNAQVPRGSIAQQSAPSTPQQPPDQNGGGPGVSGNEKPNLPLAKNEGAADVSREDPARKAERILWDYIKHSSVPVVFQDYLNRYPSGRFTGPGRSKFKAVSAAHLEQPIRDPGNARAWRNAGLKVDELLELSPNDAEGVSWKQQADREIANERVSANRDSPINSMEIEFVSIPAGRFMMGCSQGDGQCYADEKPQYEVQITRRFQLGKYEVTQGQWAQVMGSNPSKFKGEDRLPVEEVSWNDVQRFIAKLNALNDGYRYRLPTEAEWEYAARGGTTGVYYGSLDEIGWYEKNSGSKTHPVGQKQPNAFGLYDMLGNVWEWCADGYDKSYYGSSPGSDPKGPDSAQARVLRGGSWDDLASNARASSRVGVVPFVRGNAIGFRVCREPR